jgi:hypothetical protein
MATTETVRIFKLLARRVRRAHIRPYRTPKSKHVFTQHEHLTVLVFKTLTRASTRTMEMLAPLVLGRSMDHSTPGKAARRLGPALLHRLLVACLPAVRGRIVALDSTGFSTSTRSPYYARRFFARAPCGFVKCSILIDARILAPAAAGARHLVADKAYDAEWLHRLLAELGVQPHIPVRAGTRRGRWRRRHAKEFSMKIFHRRPLVETTHSVVKRRWGGTVAARNVVMIRIEILLKLVAHNLMLCVRNLTLCWMMSTQLSEKRIGCKPLSTVRGRTIFLNYDWGEDY